MNKGIKVSDISAGGQVRGVFAVQRLSQGTTRNGSPFWSLVLTDSTGSIDAKIWSPADCGLSEPPSEGSVLSVLEAKTTKYKDALQISIEKAQLLTGSGDYDPAWFCKTGSRTGNSLWQELWELKEKTLTYKPWGDLLEAVFSDRSDLRDAFCRAPGAVEVHHAYIGGLLEHTLGVCRLVLQFSDLYPDLDREILFVGAFLHDIGKIREYSCGTTISVTDDGRLLGHIGAGLVILEPFLEQSSLSDSLKSHLKHLVLSHHGELAFGSPVLPQTQEAIALHFADNFDAKMAICRKALQARKGQQPWTDSIFCLDRRRLMDPEKTPAGPSRPAMPAKPALSDTQVFKSPVQTPDPSEPEYTDVDAPYGDETCSFSMLDVMNEGDPPFELTDEPDFGQGAGKTKIAPAKEKGSYGEGDSPQGHEIGGPAVGSNSDVAEEGTTQKKIQGGTKKREKTENGEGKNRSPRKKNSKAGDAGGPANVHDTHVDGSLL